MYIFDLYPFIIKDGITKNNQDGEYLDDFIKNIINQYGREKLNYIITDIIISEIDIDDKIYSLVKLKIKFTNLTSDELNIFLSYIDFINIDNNNFIYNYDGNYNFVFDYKYIICYDELVKIGLLNPDINKKEIKTNNLYKLPLFKINNSFLFENLKIEQLFKNNIIEIAYAEYNINDEFITLYGIIEKNKLVKCDEYIDIYSIEIPNIFRNNFSASIDDLYYKIFRPDSNSNYKDTIYYNLSQYLRKNNDVLFYDFVENAITNGYYKYNL